MVKPSAILGESTIMVQFHLVIIIMGKKKFYQDE